MGHLIDFSIVKMMSDGDDFIELQLLNMFMSKQQELVTDLNKAFDKENTFELGTLMHQLKSSAKIVGALQLASICENFEEKAQVESIDTLKALREEFLSVLNQTMDEIKAHVDR